MDEAPFFPLLPTPSGQQLSGKDINVRGVGCAQAPKFTMYSPCISTFF